MRFNNEIIFTILLILLFLGCYKFIFKGQLNFIMSEGIKLKDITNLKGNMFVPGAIK